MKFSCLVALLITICVACKQEGQVTHVKANAGAAHADATPCPPGTVRSTTHLHGDEPESPCVNQVTAAPGQPNNGFSTPSPTPNRAPTHHDDDHQH